MTDFRFQVFTSFNRLVLRDRLGSVVFFIKRLAGRLLKEAGKFRENIEWKIWYFDLDFFAILSEELTSAKTFPKK